MSVIYHLAPAARWSDWPAGEPYLPAEYAADGFVHCTAGDELMVRVANRFYRELSGDFVVLVLDTERLEAPVKWEAPAGADDQLAPEFPHIYGPINAEAISNVRPVVRDADGTFTEIVTPL